MQIVGWTSTFSVSCFRFLHELFQLWILLPLRTLAFSCRPTGCYLTVSLLFSFTFARYCLQNFDQDVLHKEVHAHRPPETFLVKLNFKNKEIQWALCCMHRAQDV